MVSLQTLAGAGTSRRGSCPTCPMRRGWRAGRGLGRRCGWWSIRCIVSSTGSFGRSLGYRLSCRLPDKVTAVSRSVAEAHLFAGMVLAGQLAVLPNGVDVRYFRPDAEVRRALRQKSGVQEGEFLWFAAGRLEPVKGLSDVAARHGQGSRTGTAGDCRGEGYLKTSCGRSPRPWD